MKAACSECQVVAQEGNTTAEQRANTERAKPLTPGPALPARPQAQSLPFLASPPCVFCRGNLQFRLAQGTRASISFWPYHGSLAPLCLINSLILPNSSPLVKKSTLAQRAVCSVLGCGKLFDYAMSLRQHSGQVLQVLCATVKALDLLPASCQSRKMGCLSLGFPPLSGSFLWDVSYPAHPRPNLNSCNLSSQPL